MVTDSLIKVQKDNFRVVSRTLMKPSKFMENPSNYLNKACFSYNYIKYGSFDNWEIAMNILSNLPREERLFHEKLLSCTKVKPYFDIEFLDKEYPTIDLDELKLAIKTNLIEIFIENFEITINSRDIFIAKCHRQTEKGLKYSYHVIISTHPGIVCENTTDVLFIARLLEKKLKWKKIVDLGIYGKTQNFRMIGHCKEGSLDFPFVPENEESPVLEFIVSNIDEEHTVLDIKEQKDNEAIKIKNIERLNFLEEPDLINEILRKVSEYHKSAEFIGQDAKGFLQFKYDDKNEKCFTSSSEDPRYHDKLGFYAFVTKTNDICLGCHSARCRDNENKKIIKRIGTKGINSKKEFKKVHEDETEFDISDYDIENSIRDDEYGLAELFCKLYKSPDRIKWISEGRPGQGVCYFWNGNIWERDDKSYIDRLCVKIIVGILRKYIMNNERVSKNETDLIGNPDNFETNIKKASVLITQLNKGTMHHRVLNFAKPQLSDPTFNIKKDEHPGMLSCFNGMVNLCTGELRPAVPDDNITKCLSTGYDINADTSIFENFVRDITADISGRNDEIYNYLRWLMGYAMHGNPIKKLFVIFYGPWGNNGKSMLMNTIMKVLEHYAESMDKYVVLDGPKKTAGGTSSELVAMVNKRFGILGDVKENETINDGQMKILTGVTDVLSVRELYTTQRPMKPVFLPILGSNFTVNMNLSDTAMFERLVIIHFKLRFTDNPSKPYERLKDDNLEFKFNNNKQGTLKWLIDAAVFFHQNKDYQMPECVYKEKLRYKENINPCINFINTNFDKNIDAKIQKAELLELYKFYCRENNIKFISNNAEKEFDSILEYNLFDSKGTLNPKGKTKIYLGIQNIQETNED